MLPDCSCVDVLVVSAEIALEIAASVRVRFQLPLIAQLLLGRARDESLNGGPTELALEPHAPCGAISDWQKELQTSQTTMSSKLSASSSPEDIKTQLVAFMEDAAESTEDMVDKVKQAELFGILREEYGIVRDDTIQLKDFNTLNKIATFMASKAGTSAPLPVALQRSEQEATPDAAPWQAIRKATESIKFDQYSTEAAPAAPAPAPLVRADRKDILARLTGLRDRFHPRPLAVRLTTWSVPLLRAA